MAGELSRDVLIRARAGDGRALNHLRSIYRPALRRWAQGRLPECASDLATTEDLLQEALAQALNELPRLASSDALHTSLRLAVFARFGQKWRHDSTVQAGVSPLDAAIGSRRVKRYEAALARLSVSDREAIIGRLELGLTFDDLAGALRKPNADAACVAVTRALVRLATLLGERDISSNRPFQRSTIA